MNSYILQGGKPLYDFDEVDRRMQWANGLFDVYFQTHPVPAAAYAAGSCS